MNAQSALDAALPPAVVFTRLDAAVQRLVLAVQTIYGGSWDDCAEDQRRRQAGRPHLYRLHLDSHLAMDDCLGWLDRLKAYELARGERFAAADSLEPVASVPGKDER
jgi:hypothetical protein